MRLPYVRDYDLDEAQFRTLLNGELSLGRLNSQGGAHTSARKAGGFDFLTAWLPKNYPELI